MSAGPEQKAPAMKREQAGFVERSGSAVQGVDHEKMITVGEIVRVGGHEVRIRDGHVEIVPVPDLVQDAVTPRVEGVDQGGTGQLGFPGE